MRRMFRRNVRKTLAQEVPPILQEANFTFDKGEYGRAAELFEQIAQTADARGGPRAPIYQLQAGRARLFAGQIRLAMPSLLRGLELFAQRKQFQRLHAAGQRILIELKEGGFTAEAAQVEGLIGGTTAIPEPTVPSSTRHSKLPTHCPHCGAAIRPDEIEWLDEVTGECAYCGSPVRDET